MLEKEVKVALFQPALPDGPRVRLFQVLRIFRLREGETRRRFILGVEGHNVVKPVAVIGPEPRLEVGQRTASACHGSQSIGGLSLSRVGHRLQA